MRIALGLLIGAVLAVIVACGGASKKTAAPPQAVMPGPDASGMAASPRQPEIDALDAKIGEDLTKLNLPRPAAPASPTAMAAGATPAKPSADPTCKPAQSETCKDSCTLADSICDNAKKICDIATELGNDAYANSKCSGGNSSCESARERCCGCLL
jgi:hypothetical protein